MCTIIKPSVSSSTAKTVQSTSPFGNPSSMSIGTKCVRSVQIADPGSRVLNSCFTNPYQPQGQYLDYKDEAYCRNKLVLKATYYDRALTASLYVLQKPVNGITIANRRLSGTEIWDETRIAFGDLVDALGEEIFSESQRDTFLQYLSKHVRDPESPLNSEGQRKGYYIDERKVSTPQGFDAQIDNPGAAPQILVDGSSTRTRVARESTLYSVLVSMLLAGGYQAADISNSKLGGKWGNPDVAGIRTIEGFTGTSVEIATIELKLSSNDWQRQYFEAVSHLRFSNRSYFAYAERRSREFVWPPEMRTYAEKFKVGILKLILEDQDYDNLINGDQVKPLSSSDVEIVEIFPAPYTIPPPQEQLQFCQNLGIYSLKNAHSWGKAAH